MRFEDENTEGTERKRPQKHAKATKNFPANSANHAKKISNMGTRRDAELIENVIMPGGGFPSSHFGAVWSYLVLKFIGSSRISRDQFIHLTCAFRVLTGT